MTAATLTIGGRRPVLGTFSTGCAGSVALNFAPSGGANCDAACPYHPATTSPHAEPAGARCYAVKCEARYSTTLAPKLARHAAAGAEAVVAAADRECAERGYRLPWFRFSAFGSVPAAVPAGFRRLVERLAAAGTPVHLPIESARKANRYRRARQGLGVAVRESVAGRRRWLAAPAACSVVGGTMADAPRERIAASKALAAARRRATGRRVVVCPAVAGKHLRTGTDRAKCGRCTACADPGTDIVYPAH